MKKEIGRLKLKEGTSVEVIRRLENIFIKHGIFIATDKNSIVVSDLEKAKRIIKND